MNNPENLLDSEPTPTSDQESTGDSMTGISIESASYMENNAETQEVIKADLQSNNNTETQDHTPQLFSDESINSEDNIASHNEETESSQNDQLFDQDENEEEDFEIPAFLRKQKF